MSGDPNQIFAEFKNYEFYEEYAPGSTSDLHTIHVLTFTRNGLGYQISLDASDFQNTNFVPKKIDFKRRVVTLGNDNEETYNSWCDVIYDEYYANH